MQRGFVPAGSYDYYTFLVDVKLNFTFTVTATSGAVSMYINACQTNETACASRRPSSRAYTWSSASSLSSQVIAITDRDRFACSGCMYVGAGHHAAADRWTAPTPPPHRTHTVPPNPLCCHTYSLSSPPPHFSHADVFGSFLSPSLPSSCCFCTSASPLSLCAAARVSYVIGVLASADSNYTLVGTSSSSNTSITTLQVWGSLLGNTHPHVPRPLPSCPASCPCFLSYQLEGVAPHTHRFPPPLCGPLPPQESVPTRAYADQYQYQYFLFSFYEVHADVVISVTPFTGDPDVYVTSCYLGPAGQPANCTTRPSNTSYVRRAV
jgi:hypothetical protein